MAISDLKGIIDATITTNGRQEITGASLNEVLTQMVDATDAELATKTNESDVSRLILLEHIYFLYKANENRIYYRGLNTQEWMLVLPYILNATFAKPLTPHLSITTNDGISAISTNAFEIDLSIGEPKMTWLYNGKKFSLVFGGSGNGGQIITSQDIEYATKQYVENLLGTIINGDY